MEPMVRGNKLPQWITRACWSILIAQTIATLLAGPAIAQSESAQVAIGSIEATSPDQAQALVLEAPEITSPTARQARSPMMMVGYSDVQPPSFATPEMVAWLSQLIHNNLPPTYEDDRKWDQQREVWDGIQLRREGMRIETKRKKKMVNAGTWTRYKIDLVDPDRLLVVRFHRLEPTPDGGVAFHVTVDCNLDVFGRLSQWVRDVQVISISANADAACRLTLIGTVAVKMNVFKLPPDLAVRPHVDVAHIELTHYRVRRISQVGGDFAKVLGNGLRGVVDDKLEDLNGKLADKINKQIEKHQDRLTFAPQAWLKTKLPISGSNLAPPAEAK